MPSKSVVSNLQSSFIAAVIATIIYAAITSFFAGGLNTSIITWALLLGLFTLVVSFLIGSMIRMIKAKG